jgi:hypothetical protein
MNSNIPQVPAKQLCLIIFLTLYNCVVSHYSAYIRQQFHPLTLVTREIRPQHICSEIGGM